MNKNKLKIGYTGPSAFGSDIQRMIEDYFDAIPIYINQNKEEDIEYILNQLDGVILSGGVDICPLTYNQDLDRGDNIGNFDIKRDKRELFVIDWCFKKDLPILGICRGHQLLGIYHKIPLIQEIGYSSVPHGPRGKFQSQCQHLLYCLNDYHEEFFKDELVSSYHHQALPFYENIIPKYQKRGVEVLGYSHLTYADKKDKIIELMRGIKNRWISCQNHIEIDYNKNDNLVKIVDKFKEMMKV